MSISLSQSGYNVSQGDINKFLHRHFNSIKEARDAANQAHINFDNLEEVLWLNQKDMRDKDTKKASNSNNLWEVASYLPDNYQFKVDFSQAAIDTYNNSYGGKTQFETDDGDSQISKANTDVGHGDSGGDHSEAYKLLSASDNDSRFHHDYNDGKHGKTWADNMLTLEGDVSTDDYAQAFLDLYKDQLPNPAPSKVQIKAEIEYLRDNGADTTSTHGKSISINEMKAWINAGKDYDKPRHIDGASKTKIFDEGVAHDNTQQVGQGTPDGQNVTDTPTKGAPEADNTKTLNEFFFGPDGHPDVGYLSVHGLNLDETKKAKLNDLIKILSKRMESDKSFTADKAKALIEQYVDPQAKGYDANNSIDKVSAQDFMSKADPAYYKSQGNDQAKNDHKWLDDQYGNTAAYDSVMKKDDKKKKLMDDFIANKLAPMQGSGQLDDKKAQTAMTDYLNALAKGDDKAVNHADDWWNDELKKIDPQSTANDQTHGLPQDQWKALTDQMSNDGFDASKLSLAKNLDKFYKPDHMKNLRIGKGEDGRLFVLYDDTSDGKTHIMPETNYADGNHDPIPWSDNNYYGGSGAGAATRGWEGIYDTMTGNRMHIDEKGTMFTNGGDNWDNSNNHYKPSKTMMTKLKKTYNEMFDVFAKSDRLTPGSDGKIPVGNTRMTKDELKDMVRKMYTGLYNAQGGNKDGLSDPGIGVANPALSADSIPRYDEARLFYDAYGSELYS